MWDQSLSTLFERGGPVMWPLLFLSIVTFAVLVDRTLAQAVFRANLEQWLARVGPEASQANWTQVARLLDNAPLDRLAAVYVKHRGDTAELRNEVVRREGLLLLEPLTRRMHWLAAAGQLAPMLGLLGTVTGLVTAFHQVEVLGGSVRPADLASGIWEALLTTVFGLVIAVPALAGRHLFLQRIDRFATAFTLLVSYLDEWNAANMASARGADAHGAGDA